jgi:hypothetical protein
MSDPKRLVDSGSSALKTLLETAHVGTANFEPPAGMAEAQWNALEAKLASNGLTTNAGDGAPGAHLRHLPKLGGAAIVSALVLGGFFGLQQKSQDTNIRPPQIVSAVEPPVAMPAPVAVAPVRETLSLGVAPDSLPVASSVPVSGAVSVAVSGTVRPASKMAASPSASASAESPDAELEEAGSVREARRALRQGNASEALSILAAYDKSHRTGMLRQERSFLRIEALSLQSNAGAETEAAAFLKTYPNSPYADRVRAMKR